jgi:hypothetical protein
MLKTPRILVTLALALGPMLTGCLSSAMNPPLQQSVGQPAHALFAKIGWPDRETVVAGRKVYIWSTQHLGPQVFGEGAEYNCQIRVFADDRDIVTGTDWRGNILGCSEYTARLAR